MSLDRLNSVLSNANIGKDKIYLDRKGEIQACKAGGLFRSIKWHILNTLGYYNSSQSAVANTIHSVVIQNLPKMSEISLGTAQSLISKLKELREFYTESETGLDQPKKLNEESETDLDPTIMIPDQSKKLAKESKDDLDRAITMIYNVKKPENKPKPDRGLQLQRNAEERYEDIAQALSKGGGNYGKNDVRTLFSNGAEKAESLPKDVAENLFWLIQNLTPSDWQDMLKTAAAENTIFVQYLNQRFDLNLVIKQIIPFIIDQAIFLSQGKDEDDVQGMASLLLNLAVTKFIEQAPEDKKASIFGAWSEFRGELMYSAS